MLNRRKIVALLFVSQAYGANSPSCSSSRMPEVMCLYISQHSSHFCAAANTTISLSRSNFSRYCFDVSDHPFRGKCMLVLDHCVS